MILRQFVGKVNDPSVVQIIFSKGSHCLPCGSHSCNLNPLLWGLIKPRIPLFRSSHVSVKKAHIPLSRSSHFSVKVAHFSMWWSSHIIFLCLSFVFPALILTLWIRSLILTRYSTLRYNFLCQAFEVARHDINMTYSNSLFLTMIYMWIFVARLAFLEHRKIFFWLLSCHNLFGLHMVHIASQRLYYSGLAYLILLWHHFFI